VGQPELAERLNEPGLRQLKQRIALRCELSPLDLNETAAYVAARVRVAGGRPDVLFTRDAILAIHEHSLGIPRTISVLCDNALVNGFASDAKPVGRQIVEEVCRDFHLTQQTASAGSRIAPVVPPKDDETATAPMFNTVSRLRRFSFF
jgi:general secretion pathway protein A